MERYLLFFIILLSNVTPQAFSTIPESFPNEIIFEFEFKGDKALKLKNINNGFKNNELYANLCKNCSFRSCRL